MENSDMMKMMGERHHMVGSEESQSQTKITVKSDQGFIGTDKTFWQMTLHQTEN